MQGCEMTTSTTYNLLSNQSIGCTLVKAIAHAKFEKIVAVIAPLPVHHHGLIGRRESISSIAQEACSKLGKIAQRTDYTFTWIGIEVGMLFRGAPVSLNRQCARLIVN